MLIALLIFFPMAAALGFAAPGRREAARDALAGITAAVEALLALVLFFRPAALELPWFFVSGLSFQADGFRRVYCLAAALLWLGSTLFSRQYFARERENLTEYGFFLFLTLGATQGLLLSADFFTAFVFFELLSLSSFPWVAHARTEPALRAACTYLAVAVIGGLILFFGLALLQNAAGTLRFDALPAALAGAEPRKLRAAGICILLGFGAKAGMFPLHIWLPKAHPVAPAPASALLSGMLTKAGIYGILMLALHVLPADRFLGLLTLGLGCVTMVLGALMALFSVNLKHTLACSSMSQIGFILLGLGTLILGGFAGEAEARELALNGLTLHMLNHSFLKLTLFLAAGAAAMDARTLDLNALRGWGRRKNAVKLAFALGTLGIGGVPLFNGYLSKTLLHEGLTCLFGTGAAPLWLLRGTEVLFLGSGGLTLAYMLKLFVCLFVEQNTDPAVQIRYGRDDRLLTPLSAAALLGGALALPLLGVPAAGLSVAGTMSALPPERFFAFAPENLLGGAISIAVGLAVYLGFIRPILQGGGKELRALWPKKLDLEEAVYRPLLLRLLPDSLGKLARVFGENLLLRPLCRGLTLAAAVLGRALDTGPDALAAFLLRRPLREEPVRDGGSLSRFRRLRTLSEATAEAVSRVLDNFSYAMMMSCLGVILSLALLFLLLRAG